MGFWSARFRFWIWTFLLLQARVSAKIKNKMAKKWISWWDSYEPSHLVLHSLQHFLVWSAGLGKSTGNYDKGMTEWHHLMYHHCQFRFKFRFKNTLRGLDTVNKISDIFDIGDNFVISCFAFANQLFFSENQSTLKDRICSQEPLLSFYSRSLFRISQNNIERIASRESHHENIPI